MTEARTPERKSKILIVDDDKDFLEVARLTLENAGYEVLTAQSGMNSLEIVRTSGRPDLVLMDFWMPGMDGIRALKLLEDFVLGNKVPVVFCSAVADRKIITHALMSGARDYLIKPFPPEDLLETVATHLGSGSS
ncbi:MAG: response regulator [Candidatus Wallbacteria bacterium]|nr:response regulator [Candidatus Wallbacteria bacterium]